VQRVKQRLGQQPANMSGLVDRIRAQAGAVAEGPLRWITLQIGRELRLITVEDICYFRADNKYVCIVTADGEALVSTPLKELLARLDPAVFWQVHRSTVVNVNAVRSVLRGLSGKLQLQLKGRPEKLEVSAAYAHLFRQL
jgi:DNA-binding LytR/AlgR family response regulator